MVSWHHMCDPSVQKAGGSQTARSSRPVYLARLRPLWLHPEPLSQNKSTSKEKCEFVDYANFFEDRGYWIRLEDWSIMRGQVLQEAWEHAMDNLSTCFHSVKRVDRNWRKSLGSFGRDGEPGPFIMGTDSLFLSHPCDLSLFLIGCHWECHGRKEAWEAG